MKIVYLHQYFTTPSAGGATRSYEFARRWAAAGHEVHVLCGQISNIESIPYQVEMGIHVHRLPTKYDAHSRPALRIRSFLSFAFRSSFRARRLSPDVVYASSTPLTIVVPAWLATIGKPASFLLEIRDMWPDVPIAMGYLENPILRWLALRLERFAYSKSIHIVTLAPGMREDVCAKGVSESKVTVIPQGCDVDLFSSDTELQLPSILETDLSLTPDKRIILYAGAIGHANGVDLIIRLATAAQTRAPQLVFVVIGGGPETANLIHCAKKAGVFGVNFFYRPPLAKTQVVQWFRAATATLALFRGPNVLWKDAVQNKFFDSIASGRPVFSNFRGWQTQVAIENGVGEQLEADPVDAVDQLASRVFDDKWLKGVEERCSQLAAREFNRDSQARQVLTLLESAVR